MGVGFKVSVGEPDDGSINLTGISKAEPTPPQAKYRIRTVPPGNPDPGNFRILTHYVLGRNLAVEILYPDCDNYEGRKILVFIDVPNVRKILKEKRIDPHFCRNDGRYHPFARFEPTEAGWAAARELVSRTHFGS